MTTYPVCINKKCRSSNPGNGKHCDRYWDVTCCAQADIEYRETSLSRAIAWLKKYWLNFALILAVLATILFLAVVNWMAIS
jgi:hypothetical protein